ncbi:hypothetical protein AAHB60_03250 [Pseudomonas aeruginosa]
MKIHQPNVMRNMHGKNIQSPRDCSSAELDIFERLVSAGGEVSLVGLRQRIQSAEKLIFINDGECVAIGAIKNPSTKYKARVFKNLTLQSQTNTNMS